MIGDEKLLVSGKKVVENKLAIQIEEYEKDEKRKFNLNHVQLSSRANKTKLSRHGSLYGS